MAPAAPPALPSASPGSRRKRGLALRVLALVVLLGVVAAWAHAVRRDRRERVAWDRTLEVAVVVLARDPADPGIEVLRDGLPALARRLAEEKARHRGDGPPPVTFAFRGPVASRPLPFAPDGPGLLDRARHAAALWWELRAVDRAAGMDDGRGQIPYDARLYVLLEPPARGGPRSFAEGIGALGGEVGVVRAAVDGGDATLALAAIGHELLHCLGATDKYDPAGHALLPEGLVEPGRSPQLPQRLAEWMVGEVPLGPGLEQGRLPDSLAELGVGPETAREIGWLPPGEPR